MHGVAEGRVAAFACQAKNAKAMERAENSASGERSVVFIMMV
jgi:hypothetical protein